MRSRKMTYILWAVCLLAALLLFPAYVHAEQKDVYKVVEADVSMEESAETTAETSENETFAEESEEVSKKKKTAENEEADAEPEAAEESEATEMPEAGQMALDVSSIRNMVLVIMLFTAFMGGCLLAQSIGGGK